MEISDEDYHFIKKVSRKYSRRPQDADDIAHISAIRYCTSSFEIKTKKSSYIFKLVRNCAFNFYRGEKSLCSLEALGDPYFDTVLKDKVDIVSLLNSVEKLPQKQKKCFQLRFDGLKFGEIGSELGISLDSAKANYYNAVKKLRPRLKYSGFYIDKIASF
ncbi:MAG: hypothetical protein COB41_00230 [Proteobacteria bacterium]|nr:MAG: hypothetical protein COB41_00230 [Pseudomonadota bacterium]